MEKHKPDINNRRLSIHVDDRDGLCNSLLCSKDCACKCGHCVWAHDLIEREDGSIDYFTSCFYCDCEEYN